MLACIGWACIVHWRTVCALSRFLQVVYHTPRHMYTSGSNWMYLIFMCLCLLMSVTSLSVCLSGCLSVCLYVCLSVILTVTSPPPLISACFATVMYACSRLFVCVIITWFGWIATVICIRASRRMLAHDRAWVRICVCADVYVHVPRTATYATRC